MAMTGAERQKEYRERQVNMGRCGRCYQPNNNGKILCDQCREYNRNLKVRLKDRAKARERMARLRAKRKAEATKGKPKKPKKGAAPFTAAG
jgi:hypothetical protein